MTPQNRIFGRLAMALVPAALLGWGLFALVPTSAPEPCVYISEMMAKNLSGVVGAAGTPCDWVELCNGGDTTINLSGWSLSDSAADPRKWTFPDCAIAPGDYLLLYAEGADASLSADGLHLPFALNGNGGTLVLTDPDGVCADKLVYEGQKWDIPYGRLAADPSRQGYFAAATPGAANPTGFWGGEKLVANSADAVFFSEPAGCYDTAFTLHLSTTAPDALILYTTDGSEPDIHAAICTAAGIPIENRNTAPNRYVNLSETLRYASIYDSAPDPVKKGTVVRARLYEDGRLGDEIFTASYFVQTECAFPIVSLAGDPTALFGSQDGLLMPGAMHWAYALAGNEYAARTGNYSVDASVDVALEQFSAEGTLLREDDSALSLTGTGSASGSVKKSFSLTLADGSKLKLRGQGSNELFKETFIDAMWGNYLAGQDIGAAENEFVCLFINGEYWGIYTRQLPNITILEQRSGLDKSGLYAVKTSAKHNVAGTMELAASAGGQDALNALNDFYEAILARDFTRRSDLAWLETQMDVDAYIRYILAEVFVGNQDWDAWGMPNNILIWRSAQVSGESDVADGRWRWQIFDLDYSTGAVYQGYDMGNAAGDNFYDLLGIRPGDVSPPDGDTPAVHWEQTRQSIEEAATWGPGELTRLLFRKLWCSDVFRAKFMAEAEAQCGEGGIYCAEALTDMVNAWQAALEPEIADDLSRLTIQVKPIFAPLEERYWYDPANISMETWREGFDYMRRFVSERADYMFNFLWLDQPLREE